MPNCGVYQITNTKTNVFYIGSSKNIKNRHASHKNALRANKHQNKHLQNSWNKYGEDVFCFKILLICSEQNVRFYEQLLIDNLNPEYNQSKSAYSGIPFGAKLTPTHKAKVAEKSKAKWNDDGYRKKVIAAINAAMTKEECEARKYRAKKLWENPEYRQKSIDARIGNSFSKGYKCTPEQIENRKRAARISNMKRNYKDNWKLEYAKRYPEHVGDLNA